MLPYPDNMETKAPEKQALETIPFDIRRNLSPPESPVRLRPPVMPGTSVPKAAVDEDRGFGGRNEEIRPSREIGVLYGAEVEGRKPMAECLFRPGVPPLDSGHYPATLFPGDGIHILLYHGDSYKLIKEMPPASVDLILTDPPYNLSPYSTGNIKLSWRKEINNDLAEWDKKEFKPSDWVEEFKRVLKPTGNIFVFCSYNLIGKWHEAFDPEFDTFQFMVWHKTNPVPKVLRAGFLNSCELIVCMWDKGHTWNFSNQREMHNFIETSICMGPERTRTPFHPTQKPVRVLRHIVKVASKEGDIVFDPFMGVGSSGVAALNLGRKFIGIEIDEKYYKAAERRIQAATPNLFTHQRSIIISHPRRIVNGQIRP